MSASNTTSYLELVGLNYTMAVMTGIALVIFSSTSATAAQLFIGQQGWSKIFSVPFIVVGAVVIVFSIFSTLSLNYNKFISSEAIIHDMQEKIEKKRSELISQQKADGGSPNQWAIESMNRFLSLSEKSGESWNNSMKTIMETAQNLNESEKQIIDDLYVETLPRTFFGFMLSLNTLDKKYFFDFFMIAIPAIFYDLIAPLAITVVLFLMGFKTRKETAPCVELVDEAVIMPPSKHETEPPDIDKLTAYIEAAMQDDYTILPDDNVIGISAHECAVFRIYLSSFIYKGKPLVSERDGRYISIFDRVNLKRFVALQYDVRRDRNEILS